VTGRVIRSLFACLPALLDTRAKANLSPWWFGRCHQLSNGLKHGPKLAIVLSLECVELPGKFLVGAEHAAKLNECAHDFDVDANGPLAPQHARQHSYTLLSEGIRRRPTPPRGLGLRSQYVTAKRRPLQSSAGT
jgi:hypothetical protein